MQKYKVKEVLDKKISKNMGNLTDFTKHLLFHRGIKTKENAEKFLNPDFLNHLHDPFLLPDMEIAVERILKAIDKNEKIGIWSDYDADGIPGGAILYHFFTMIGFSNFINYIPNRHTEGYGLNKEGIEELSKTGVNLLITIDCGIRDIKEIKYALDLNIETIITDHHEQGVDLPEAFAIINPKINSSKYPEKILCGSGVVWKLIEAILIKRRDFLDVGQEKWLLDLVGLATLSDMVPLVGENRVLAHFGLSVLRKNRRVGFKKLFSMLKINKDFLNEDDIGFLVTPRINAASRMGHPIDAFKLLTAKDELEAQVFADHLDNINKERKIIVANIVKEANKKIKDKYKNNEDVEKNKPIIVLGNPDWRPALLGLAANSIAEEYKKPVFIWGREGGEFIKGSCRSDGSTDLVAIMERAKNIFLEFGGHKFSGGFAVDHTQIHFLEDALIDACLHTKQEEKEIEIDLELSLKDVNQDIINEIFKLSPFGVENPKPIFIFKNVLPEKINRFGKKKEHLSVIFSDGFKKVKGISFFTEVDKFGDFLKEGIKTNLVAHIEKSYFAGNVEIRLRIVDFF